MSEADNPNRDAGLPESVTSPDATAPMMNSQTSNSSSQNPDEGWQTLDFPGAMSVDAIPTDANPAGGITSDADPEVISALASLTESSSQDGSTEGNSEITVPETIAPPRPKLSVVSSTGAGSPESTNFAALLQQLQQENNELRDRITQLEQDLSQQQIEFQLEIARSLHTNQTEAEPIQVSDDQQRQELGAAQERISQLFQELELSQQTAQRQQILVETLSEQLESSQERIAQLERDCALAQQRYNEQVQQLLQAENTCRDLRMRLHRQQRHTLQFKAALEKCLEMPAPYRQGHFMSDINADSSSSASVTPISSASRSQAVTPKNQPVRPWSGPSGLQDAEDAAFNDHLAVPKSLFRLVNPQAFPESNITDVDPSFIASSDPTDPQTAANWMNLIFPDAAANQDYSGEALQQPNNIFDLSSFVQNESFNPSNSVDSAVQNVDSVQKDEGLLQMLASVPLDSDELGSPLGAFQWGQSTHSDDTLWDDLAKLIDLPAGAKAEAPEAVEMTAEIVSANVEIINPESTNSEIAAEGVVAENVSSENDRPVAQPSSTQIAPLSVAKSDDQEAASAKPQAASGSKSRLS